MNDKTIRVYFNKESKGSLLWIVYYDDTPHEASAVLFKNVSAMTEDWGPTTGIPSHVILVYGKVSWTGTRATIEA